MENGRSSKLLSVWGCLFSAYFSVVMFTVPYYNWRYASENGFVKWLLLGEIVPTFQGLVWPYTMYADRRHGQEVATEKAARERYSKELAEVLAAQGDSMKNGNVLAGRFQERMNLKGRKEAMRLLAVSMKDVVKRQREFVDRLMRITPPTSVQKFHSALLEMNRGAIPYTELMLAKSEQADFEGFGQVTKEAEKYTAEWLPKIRAEADKAQIEM